MPNKEVMDEDNGVYYCCCKGTIKRTPTKCSHCIGTTHVIAMPDGNVGINSRYAYGINNEVHGDCSFVGGRNAVVNPQDDGSFVVGCMEPDAAKVHSIGPSTVCIKSTGVIEGGMGSKYTHPPVIPLGGQAQSEILQGTLIHLDKAAACKKNYVATVMYERCPTDDSSGIVGPAERTGTWTYFPQRPGDWKKLTSLADHRVFPYSFAPGNVAAALDILAINAVSKGAPATTPSPSPAPAPVQPPKIFKKYNTMINPPGHVKMAPVQSVSEPAHQEFHSIKLSITAASTKSYSVTLLRIPTTTKYSVLHLAESVLTWETAGNNRILASLVSPTIWIPQDNDNNSTSLQVTPPDGETRMSIALPSRGKLTLSGTMKPGILSDSAATVVITGYVRLVFIM